MSKINLLLLKKIRARGLSWFFARILGESNQANSTTIKIMRPVINIIYWLFLYPINKYKSLTPNAKHILKDTLFLFYDLEVSPVTYDFAWALVLAEHRRKKLELNHTHIVFVPGRLNGLREEDPDYDRKIDLYNRSSRKYTILYSLTNLLPTCIGVTFCASRNEAHILCEQARPNIYPEQYSVTFPIPHSNFNSLAHDKTVMSLAPTKQAIRYINQWLSNRLNGRKLIVITLRQSSYMPARNSNIQSWSKFAKNLETNLYFVVFVPDTEKALEKEPEELTPFCYFTDPCWNTDLRAALYQSAFLTLGVNNGPMALCWLNQNCNYIMFKVNTESVPQTTIKRLNSYGFTRNQSLPFARASQKWVWKEDNEDIIQDEFDKMCSLIVGYH